jgi:hypothetical protein
MFLKNIHMAVRFMGKNPHRKVVRQIPNRKFSHRVTVKNEENLEENKELKTDKEMADDRLEKIEQIMGTKAPKRTVKREKRDKGLIERTENSTILLTEDNKMVLND